MYDVCIDIAAKKLLAVRWDSVLSTVLWWELHEHTCTQPPSSDVLSQLKRFSSSANYNAGTADRRARDPTSVNHVTQTHVFRVHNNLVSEYTRRDLQLHYYGIVSCMIL